MCELNKSQVFEILNYISLNRKTNTVIFTDALIMGEISELTDTYIVINAQEILFNEISCILFIKEYKKVKNNDKSEKLKETIKEYPKIIMKTEDDFLLKCMIFLALKLGIANAMSINSIDELLELIKEKEDYLYENIKDYLNGFTNFINISTRLDSTFNFEENMKLLDEHMNRMGPIENGPNLI